MQMLIVLGVVIVWCWFVFAEAEITTTAAATTTVTACYNGANDEACLSIESKSEKKKKNKKIMRMGETLLQLQHIQTHAHAQRNKNNVERKKTNENCRIQPVDRHLKIMMIHFKIAVHVLCCVTYCM